MKLTQLSNLFDITYGNGFELNKLELSASSGSGVNFVSRTSKNNGVAAKVRELPNSTPFASGLITVAVSGSVLETFLQPEPFYTAYHVMVLTPKGNMTEEEKLFYCACIRRNKYRYSYGRQANKTLKKIEVPSIAPKWISRINAKSRINNNIHSRQRQFLTDPHGFRYRGVR